MTFDTGVLNTNTLTVGARLFETNIVVSASTTPEAMTAKIGHTVVSLTQNSATLVGTIEATTIDPMFAFFLGDEIALIVQGLIGSVGMNGSISANAEGFSYTHSFNVPNDTVSEDVQSFFQFRAVVTDTFPADLYTTPQVDGTLTVSNDLTSLMGLTSGPILDQFTVSESAPSGTPLTVLVANFVNGNNAALNSRIYLYNPSEIAGQVTVRVFTLPLKGGIAEELTTTPLNLGTLDAKSALNTKLAEDILTPLGITTPYTGNGGNLTLEFTIHADKVQGAAQVFSTDFAFGTYPLQEIPSTSAGSPTVLGASFMNGNNTAFNSRIYLWNPSASTGEVTVRVFSLPLNTGVAQELTGAPLSLGTLAPKSALNIKLAENILTPLGITPPYTNDGGNLTLEFTIQAADVRGVAQVFSSSFAFGTYPMQVIQ